MSWLTYWNRRKLITVNGSTTGAQSDYQMKLTVNQASGADSAGVVNLGGNVLPSFYDLRFTKSDGSTTLNYWIESITGTSPNQIATVWIKLAPSLDTIPASPGTYNFYIYYSNISAYVGSSGVDTFILFDDFSSGNLNGWTQYNSGNPATISTEWSISNDPYSVKVSSTYPNDAGIKKSISVTNVRLIVDAKISSTSSSNGLYTDNSGWIRQSIGETINWESSTITTTSPFFIFLRTGYTVGSGSVTGYFDRIRIRKYVSPEPTFSVAGTEELGITAYSMSLNPNDIPCRTGICTITATVTWQNLINSSITFRPTIIIDGVTYVQAASDTTIVGAYPATSSPIQITTPTLSVGTHSICPYPN